LISAAEEVEVFAFLNKWDRRILHIHKLQVEDLISSSNACVKTLVFELNSEPQLLGVESDG
jgi:hypothetical protein